MENRFIEASNVEGGGANWGKFMVSRFGDDDWAHPSDVDMGRSLLAGRGWTRQHIMVTDLQTGEGALFLPGGLACDDLQKHRIWVCPLFEPFLEWLYTQDLADLSALPRHVALPRAPSAIWGYRRPGPDANEGKSRQNRLEAQKNGEATAPRRPRRKRGMKRS